MLPGGLDFSSNDYLGFARHPALRVAAIAALEEYGVVGAGGSRLLRGHHPAHARLEECAAAFFGSGKALYFSSGFLANVAIFTTLPTRHDAVIFDEAVHASVKDGIHAGAGRNATGRGTMMLGPFGMNSSVHGWMVRNGSSSRWKASTAWTETSHR